MLEIRKYLSLKRFILFPMIGAAFLTVDCATFAQGTTLYVLTQNASHDRGYSYIVKQDFRTPPDTALAPMISKLRIFENGIELGPAHSLRADTRRLGMGRFSHWGQGQLGISKLYFSTSDNTDPRTNGRIYTYQIDAELAPTPAPAPTPSTITGPVFYVAPTGNDSNSGSQSAPWRTLTKAAAVLTAGQTAIVMDGTYEEGAIMFRNSGTVSAPITIMAQNTQQAILSSTSGCTESMGIYASYITIDGLRLQVSPNEPAPSGCSTANYFVHAWELTNPSVSNPSSGYVGFTLRNTRIEFSTHRNGDFKARQDFSLIENNVLSNGSECFNNTGCIVRNNTVNGPPRDWIPILIGKGGVRNMQIYNNVIHIVTSNNTGIVLGETTGTPYMFDGTYEAFNAVAYNNVILNNSGASTVGAIGMVACKDCVLLNNVAIGGQLFLRLDGSGSPGLSSLNPTFKNNIVTCGNGSATGPWDYTGTLTVDYNDFYQCTGVPSQAHAIVGDPKFVNPASDWNLQPGSPALGSGVEVSMTGISIDVSRNKDGNIRTPAVNLGIY